MQCESGVFTGLELTKYNVRPKHSIAHDVIGVKEEGVTRS